MGHFWGYSLRRGFWFCWGFVHGVTALNESHRCNCCTRSTEKLGAPSPARCDWLQPQRPPPLLRCRHSRHIRLSSPSRSRVTSLSNRDSASGSAMPRPVNWCSRRVKVSISRPFIAVLCGQHQRSGSGSGVASFAADSPPEFSKVPAGFPTKPTKPPFVGFVGSVPGLISVFFSLASQFISLSPRLALPG